jgi:hypothetical protein
MKHILILVLLVGLAGAVGGPAGVVMDADQAETPLIDLSGISASVFGSVAFDNGDLGQPHYFSELRTMKQNNSPIDSDLQNWSAEWVPLPASFIRK